MPLLLGALDVLRTWGPWALIAFLVIYFGRVVLDKDRSDLWRSRVYRAVFSVTGKREHEKKYVGNDVMARLNLARRALRPVEGILPRAVKVDWVEGGEGAAYDLKEGQFVVRLDPSTQQERNIALLACAIVRRTTLTGLRHSVEEPLQVAIDMNLARTLLSRLGTTSALDWFLANDYRTATSASPQALRRNEQVLALDQRGLFTLMFLVELEDFERRIRGMAPKPYMAGEIEGLLDFLCTLAGKEVGEEVPLNYSKAYIRVGVIIVAKKAKLLESVEPYVLALQHHFKKQMNSVYVIVYDRDWLGAPDPTVRRALEDHVAALDAELERAAPVTRSFDVEHVRVGPDGKRRHGRCIRFTLPEQALTLGPASGGSAV